MARGSPCVVPSEENISLLPGISNQWFFYCAWVDDARCNRSRVSNQFSSQSIIGWNISYRRDANWKWYSWPTMCKLKNRFENRKILHWEQRLYGDSRVGGMASSRKAEPISLDEEAFLCRVKSLANNAKAIVNNVYYLLCDVFVIIIVFAIPFLNLHWWWFLSITQKKNLTVQWHLKYSHMTGFEECHWL